MSKYVLVVDDEPAISRLIKMSLTVEGYEVRAVNSGFDALEELEKGKPELVILDVMMPGMNGFEVCTEIRKKPQFKGVKIAFLSAMGSPGDAQRGFAVGGDDYIFKPFDPEDLLAKVRDMIGPGL
ncbi:MAG: response regulator [Candidatus Firestonebacteria bacterium]|nr:response regulator [Candidatus Firestonebacteria bacterium]